MIDVSGNIKMAFEAEPRGEARAYIGASSVGHVCDACVAFSFRGYPDKEPDQQLKRIFRDGHRIEGVVVRDMRKAGMHVMEKDPMTGKQWSYDAYGGHAVGHADGLLEVDGEIVGVEIKSMGDAKFKEFVSKGVKRSHPIYYDQMQFMMGMSGVRKFVLVSYNKNNSDYHHEWVDFDEFRYLSLEAKVERVLVNDVAKISHDEADWRCRGCFKFNACWRDELPEKRTVRTCGNSRGRKDGTFECDVCGADQCSDWTPFKPREKE